MGKLETTAGIGFGLLMFTVFVAAFIGIPLLLIWCLNTLGATISYGLMEWIAAAILSMFFLGGSGSAQ